MVSSKTTKKIYVITVGEDISEGLLEDQLIDPIDTVTCSTARYINICQPHRMVWRNRVLNIPFCPPPRYLFLTCLIVLLKPLAFLFAAIVAFFIGFKKGCIVHARGYFSGLVAFYLKKYLDKKEDGIKVIFDPRSLFIDELISSGAIIKGSLVDRIWREIEKYSILAADVVICVARSQERFYVDNYGSKEKFRILPCFATIDKDAVPVLSRLEYGLSNSDVVIGYYGSLNGGWNNIETYLEICDRNPHYKFLFISQDNMRYLDKFKLRGNIVSPDTTLMGRNQIKGLLRLCDYGLIYMKRSIDWESRLGVKFVEYLNSGIDVIVNEYVGEAAYYCKNFFPDRSVVIESTLLPLGLTRKSSINILDSRMFLFSTERLEKVYFELSVDG